MINARDIKPQGDSFCSHNGYEPILSRETAQHRLNLKSIDIRHAAECLANLVKHNLTSAHKIKQLDDLLMEWDDLFSDFLKSPIGGF